MSSVLSLAAKIASIERQLAASRTPQLRHSSVTTSDGEELGVVEGLEAGFKAGPISQQAKAAAEDAYQAAHNIGPDQLLEGAVTFGKIAVGAVGALAIKADAIDGKVITGITVRTAASGPRIVLQPGAGTVGYGSAVIQASSGAASEKAPGEVIAVNQGGNSFLSLFGPANTTNLSDTKRAMLTLGAVIGSPGTTEAVLAADKINLGARPGSVVEVQGTLVADNIGDTGWLAISQSNTSFYTTVQGPAYRVVNGVIYFRGRFKNLTTTGYIGIGSLPFGLAPASFSAFPSASTSDVTYVVAVNDAGVISIKGTANSSAECQLGTIVYPVG